MKTPSSTLELSAAIESMVATYMESVRAAAEQAVDRALSKPVASRRRSPSRSASASATATARTTAGRRTAAELEQVCEALCERVRAQPGASMVELAEVMGVGLRSLQGPMAKLKAEGRVRTVGQRHLTRYYPAVIKAAGSAA